MKNLIRKRSSILGALALSFAPVIHAVEVIPLTFDPNTFFEGGITAGIDFDDGSPTQEGFLGIPASNDKSYNVTTNGITFDLQVRNANLGNQNRYRGAGALASSGPLIADFEQFYGSHPEAGNEVEATLTLTGLDANTDYQVSFFTVNVGCCQSRTRFYDGATSDDPLIIDHTTSGNSNNYAAWAPGITLQFNSGSNAEIVVTLQAEESLVGENFESRLGICGISVVSLGEPPLTPDLEITSIAYDPVTEQVTLTFNGLPGTPYACMSSTDLVDFATSETPVEGSLTADENGMGTFVVSATEGGKFYRLEPLAVP